MRLPTAPRMARSRLWWRATSTVRPAWMPRVWRRTRRRRARLLRRRGDGRGRSSMKSYGQGSPVKARAGPSARCLGTLPAMVSLVHAPMVRSSPEPRDRAEAPKRPVAEPDPPDEELDGHRPEPVRIDRSAVARRDRRGLVGVRDEPGLVVGELEVTLAERDRGRQASRRRASRRACRCRAGGTRRPNLGGASARSSGR